MASIAETIISNIERHETELHRDLVEFNPDLFMDKGSEDPYDDAMARLNSIGMLDYCFYDIFKPIGGSREKYIRAKAFTSGDLEISGVVNLADCEHWEWEYGSKEYLRSLNTGNQRYLFKLSIPFNDENSILYWKPDEKEQLEPDPDAKADEEPKYRYYKPYETERFLRWFGTNYVPMFDVDEMTKTTICSIPVLSNDVYSDKFHQDATHIANPDLAKAKVDESTSQSLLTLAPKAHFRIVNLADENHMGQYAEFIVSGHQQTSAMSFCARGRMLNVI